MIWIIIKFIIANILLLMLSSTLIGFIVRGIIIPKTESSMSGYIAELNKNNKKRGLVSAVITSCLTLILFLFLYKYTNMYILIGIFLNMISRIKDLINEIRTGILTTKGNMSNDSLDIVLNIFTLFGIGIFNYGLYLIWLN